MPHRERQHSAPRESLSGEVRGQPRAQSEPPPRTYTTEVRRASLLPDDFDQYDHQSGTLGVVIAPAPVLRSSLNPSHRPASNRPPARTESSPAGARRSMGPLATLRSMLPGAIRPEAPEDPRFQHAMSLRQQGRKLEAMMTLEELRRFEPEYPQVREMLFAVALELGVEDRVKPHADWVIQQYSQQQELDEVCSSYRALRMACPNVGLAERTLVMVLIAAEKQREGRAILDVTKLLLRDHPSSSMLPRAFLSSAQVQVAEGRPDLARATLENLIARFPHDALISTARRKLFDLT